MEGSARALAHVTPWMLHLLFFQIAQLGGTLPATRERELSAVVTVGGLCAATCEPGEVDFGAGTIVGRSGDGALLVLTAHHVIARVARPRVYVHDESGAQTSSALWRTGIAHPARVLATSSEDLALLEFWPYPDDHYALAPVAELDDLPHGGNIVGHPNGALWTVSPYRLLVDDGETFVVDCPSCGPGDSGGGVFDDAGRLDGIVVTREVVVHGATQTRSATTRFRAIARERLRSFLKLVSTQADAGARAWRRFATLRG
ncbi:MAG TPA: serine protease [Candidatus Baltobacteraceae bacterium]|nr:serine protease [Candidatus Baltobacteraceae bacterium]